MKYITDNKINKEFWFEYHCYESPNSSDAEIWRRSHQQVKVINVSEWSHNNLEDRIEDATPRIYRIKFEDGFECDAFEDELMISQKEFYRPNPTSGKSVFKDTHKIINYKFNSIW